MAKKVPSKPCGLGTCGRTVRMDNPAFPYCHDHKHLKTMESHFNSPNSGYDMDTVREVLYAPKATLRPMSKVTGDMISDNQGQSLADVTSTVLPAWREATEDYDMADPLVSYRHRDDIIDKVKTTLNDRNDLTVDTLVCREGMTLNSDGKSLPISEHRVILVSHGNNGDNIVVDVATAAPLVDNPDQLDGFESGLTSFQDGIQILHLYSYATYNSSEYTDLVSETTGETVWHTEVRVNDTDEVRQQRELIAQYGIPVSPVTHRSPPPVTVTDVSDTDNINEDMTLDQMLGRMNIEPNDYKESR